jgi:ribosomal-protein-alanine N-acetyltransferase
MDGITTRLLTMADVDELTSLAVANREFLAPYSPTMPDVMFTYEGQAANVAEVLGRHTDGTMLPHVIVDTDGTIAGRINLNSIIRGVAQTASVGYWVAEDRNGRGVATAAVAHIVEYGFTRLTLHRVQGETLLHNIASQRVLERNGFERIGMAPKHLRIAGRWQDHLLYQRINDAWSESP